MKLLVLAQVPPPYHGQSAMVRLLLDELGRPGQGFELYHVNLKLSENSNDVGRWRWKKIFPLLNACIKALSIRRKHGPMALYYIPAPGVRGALYRDWVVMALCRSFFTKLILHWHAVGLGHWLETKATTTERRITRKLLGHADLAIVLAKEVADDVAPLWPKRVTIVQNSLPESGVLPPARRRNPEDPFELLYVGLCSEEKGVFDTLEALSLLHARTPGSYRLTIAGKFDCPATENRFKERVKELASVVHFASFADAEAKRRIYTKCDVLCFPTYYAQEGQPLVLIEALAHDMPIITTRWRAIPSMLPRNYVWYVDPHRPDQVAEAVLNVRRSERPGGTLREHYLLNFTPAQHASALKKALQQLDAPTPGELPLRSSKQSVSC
ncbi:MAG: glycosyltransferase family 4 protein [Nibricoccus sp.]